MDYLLWGVGAVLFVFLLWEIFGLVTLWTRSGVDDFLEERGEDGGESQEKGSSLPFLTSYEDHLASAHLGAKLESWSSLEDVTSSAFLFGVGGLALSLLSSTPASKLLVLVALFPFLRVRAAGQAVRKRVERTLPEAAALIAAELSAGSTMEDAVVRSAQLPGPLSRILSQAVDRSANEGRPLISKSGAEGGVLRETLGEMGLPALSGFAVQLDTAARAGVESDKRMQEISNASAAEYRQRIRENTKTLDKRLLAVIVGFYFGPFLIFLLGSISRLVLASF